MKKIKFLFLSLLFISPAAFAIDQVTLKSGEVVQGKILSEEANLHVDIETTNGSKRRFPYSEVASIDRDVPSNHDLDSLGNDSRVYFGFVAGGSFQVFSPNVGNNDVLFNYGARFGVIGNKWGDFARPAFGLIYTRNSISTNGFSFSTNEILGQLIFRKVSNSGFYFGPELGLAFRTAPDVDSGNSDTFDSFEAGLVGGYDYYFNSSFSFGPELHLDRIGNSSKEDVDHAVTTLAAYTTFKFLLNLTFYLQ
jgi:hypothetical protein